MEKATQFIAIEENEAKRTSKMLAEALKTKHITRDQIGKYLEAILAHLILMGSYAVSFTTENEQQLRDARAHAILSVHQQKECTNQKLEDVIATYVQNQSVLKNILQDIQAKEKVVRQDKKVILSTIKACFIEVISIVKNGVDVFFGDGTQSGSYFDKIKELFKWFKSSAQTVLSSIVVSTINPVKESEQTRLELKKLMTSYQNALDKLAQLSQDSPFSDIQLDTKQRLSLALSNLAETAKITQKNFVENTASTININITTAVDKPLEQKGISALSEEFDLSLQNTRNRIWQVSKQLVDLESAIQTKKSILPRLLKTLDKKISDLQKSLERSKQLLAGVSSNQNGQIDSLINELSTKVNIVTHHSKVLQQQKEIENEHINTIVSEVSQVQQSVDDLINQMTSFKTLDNQYTTDEVTETLMQANDFISKSLSNSLQQIHNNQELLDNNCALFEKEIEDFQSSQRDVNNLLHSLQNVIQEFSKTGIDVSKIRQFTNEKGANLRAGFGTYDSQAYTLLEEFIITGSEVTELFSEDQHQYTHRIRLVTYNMLKIKLEHGQNQDYREAIRELIKIQIEYAQRIKDYFIKQIKSSRHQKSLSLKLEELISNYKKEIQLFASGNYVEQLMLTYKDNESSIEPKKLEVLLGKIRVSLEETLGVLGAYLKKISGSLDIIRQQIDTYGQLEEQSEKTITALERFKDGTSENNYTDMHLFKETSQKIKDIISETNQHVKEVKAEFQEMLDQQKQDSKQASQEAYIKSQELYKKIQQIEQKTNEELQPKEHQLQIQKPKRQKNVKGKGTIQTFDNNSDNDTSSEYQSDQQTQQKTKSNSGVQIAVAATLILAIGCGVMYLKKRSQSRDSRDSSLSNRSNSFDSNSSKRSGV